MQKIHSRCSETEGRIEKITGQIETKENREVRTRNAIYAVMQKLSDAQADEVRSQEELTHFRRSVDRVLKDFGATIDAIGDMVKN